ncbi:MAG: hypothetical protein HZB16_18715 [Armatimonadetes bacterium]|nr:hypothetical protein [Armatimonadota bacterium]
MAIAVCALLSRAGAQAPTAAAVGDRGAKREPGTYTCKLDGGDEVRVAGPTIPAWLPDGRQLLMSNNALYRVGADGTGKNPIWQDKDTVMMLGLAVAPSGRFASALAVRRDGAGLMRVWRLTEAKGVVTEAALVLDDLLYPDAVTERPGRDGSGARYLGAISAWSPHADMLAWAPMEYEGLSKRSKSVKVYDAAAGRWSTWYLDKEAWSLTWHTERPSLMVTCGAPGRPRTPDDAPPPVSLVELSNNGQKTEVRARAVRDGGAGDAPMFWLPKCGIFSWGQSFYGADGDLVPPEPPEGDGPVARLIWASSSGRDLLLATSHITDTGDCATDLMQGLTGTGWDTFHRLLRLPVVPRQVACTPDGARLAFVVGGYIPD